MIDDLGENADLALDRRRRPALIVGQGPETFVRQEACIAGQNVEWVAQVVDRHCHVPPSVVVGVGRRVARRAIDRFRGDSFAGYEDSRERGEKAQERYFRTLEQWSGDANGNAPAAAVAELKGERTDADVADTFDLRQTAGHRA